jgi:hypothetical protein
MRLFLSEFTPGPYKDTFLKYLGYNRYDYYDEFTLMNPKYTKVKAGIEKDNSDFIIYAITRANYSNERMRGIMDSCCMHPFKAIVFFLEEDLKLFTKEEMDYMHLRMHLDKPKQIPLMLNIVKLMDYLIKCNTDILSLQIYRGQPERYYRWSGNQYYESPNN